MQEVSLEPLHGHEPTLSRLYSGLPNTLVLWRNLLLLSLASSLAYRRAGDILVGGMRETDFSSHADCRDDAIKSQQVTFARRLGRRMTLEPPSDVARQGGFTGPCRADGAAHGYVPRRRTRCTASMRLRSRAMPGMRLATARR
ncbi:MAG: 7-cyano-7-deazaguanine synthase [Betaproteobacteria bacterium]|nr:7-cyano-7-deazaguanine synthase [Betaproteobacteria bacterium]